jgi:ATP-dependent DNA helicase RecG
LPFIWFHATTSSSIPLFKPVESLPGIGPKLAEALTRVTGREAPEDTRALDLLLLPPHGLIDRSMRSGITEAPEGTIATLKVRVDRHQPSPPGRRNAPYRVFVHDDTGELALTFFHSKRQWLEKILPEGETVLISGKVEWFNGRPSMVHPDHIALEADADSFPLIEPVYPLTAGLSPKVLRRSIESALDLLPELPEWSDPHLVSKNSFPSFADAVRELHHPEAQIDIEPQTPARRRLAYDELLAGQLSLALVRQTLRKLPGHPVVAEGRLRQAILGALPFSLTGSQTTAVEEILADMAGKDRMLRLLQGDVGSGKTAVAMLAMADAVEAGGQAVLMAPTEILARQHHATIRKMAEAAGIEVVRAHSPRQGQGTRRTARAHRQWTSPDRDRHPRPVPGIGGVQEPHPGCGRRAAPVRRSPTAAADGQGHRAAHAGDDRDPDSAYAGPGGLRRHGCLQADRKTCRPPTDRNRHYPR